MSQDWALYSEPHYARNQDKTKVSYYCSDLTPRITSELHELLVDYSHIPWEQHAGHIHRIRDRAWDIRQYPCTGTGSWLKPQLRLHPLYSEILNRAKAGEMICDIGTFLSHDLRALVHDEAPSNNLWGVDIVSHFDVGYELFNDRERWEGNFIEADFLAASTSAAFAPLRGKVNIMIVSQVLHQWTFRDQIRAASALVCLSKRGTIIVGNQMGKAEAEELIPDGLTVPLFVNSPMSFSQLWQEVGKATGTKWNVECWMRGWDHLGVSAAESAFMGSGVGIMEFAVRRTM